MPHSPRLRSALRGAGLGATLLGGCAAPSTEPVWVDLGRVPGEPSIAARPSPAPTPPAGWPARTATVPGLPVRTLEDPSRAREADVAAVIERQQRDARRRLEARLREVYAEEARLFELDLRRELEGERPAAYDAASAQIRSAYEAYGRVRSPLSARLEILVGFPVPDPPEPAVPDGLRPVPKRRAEEAAELRAQISRLAAGYEATKQEILRAVEDTLSAKQAELLEKVRARAEELERRAAREAERQVRISVRELGLRLADVKPISLPATAARTVTLPALPPLAPAPQVPLEPQRDAPAVRRDRLERELRVWLGVRGKRLVRTGRDATEEFLQWRKSYLAGP